MIVNCLTTKFPPYEFGTSDLHTWIHGSMWYFQFTYKQSRLHFINILSNNLYNGDFINGLRRYSTAIKLNKENVPEIIFIPAY